jgi:diguanylate cyclase (GGDEF)-like protein/putative nucleotidyltransferase with HDIG domain
MIGGNPVYYYKEEIRAQRLYSILLIGVASVLTIGLGSLILYGRRLKEKTYKDSLTTLYNRFYFSDKLETILHKFKQPIAYVVADINGLNFINNSFGHRMGDEVIITVASILKDVFSNGVIIRMGGDEFLIICDQIDGATVEDKIETVYHICEQTKRFPISLSISLGYKISFDKEERFEQIFDLAENQMYQEKFNKSQSRRSDFIQTILTTLHEKDSYSEAHSTNVALYSERFAKVLGLKHEEVNQIKTAALLHDVGKIIISKSLLMKKGKLTDEEYEIMKQHPEIGYRIISSLHGMEEIAHIILCHHERWDGNGYPNKISQNNIPFASRIITIVDAFDAMTSNRLYREKVSVLEALKELKKCAGTQFDPKLVTIFISHINEIVSSE